MSMFTFPLLPMIALAAGGLLILVIKKKFRKMYKAEAILAFILYALLVALFTEPVVNVIKEFVG